MKKVVWLYSLNAQDVPILGYAPIYSYGSLVPMSKTVKLQKKLQTELLPEIQLDFISYDTTSHDLPAADLIIYNDNDAKYLNQEIKEQGLAIATQDFILGDIDKIKNSIIAFFATA